MSREAEEFAEKFTYNVIPMKSECPNYTGEECMRTSLNRKDVAEIFDAGMTFMDSLYQSCINETEINRACENAISDLYNIGSGINLEGNFKQFWEGFKTGILWEKKKHEQHDLVKNPTDIPNDNRGDDNANNVSR